MDGGSRGLCVGKKFPGELALCIRRLWQNLLSFVVLDYVWDIMGIH